jgi:hypothetical protein
VKLRGDHCQCSGPPYKGCGEYFNSTAAFDKHRTGEWTARRCLSPDEMRAIGMAQTASGFWITRKNTFVHVPAITGQAIGSDPCLDSHSSASPVRDSAEVSLL